MNRRCVTEEECHNIVSSDPKKLDLRGKRLDDFNGRNVCVLECPKNYTTGQREDGTEYCKPCDGMNVFRMLTDTCSQVQGRIQSCSRNISGPCKKVCPGKFVDSVESSTALKGCTKVTGTLKIQIRGYSANLVKELENNLDMIEEIDESLIVANSHSLFSLNFFKALKKIHGKKLEEDL